MCKVWDYENVEIIEKVQNDFFRIITTIKKSTPLYMLYVIGELGCIPLQKVIKSRMIGYWKRLVHGRQFKLLYLLYKYLYNSIIISKWLLYIKGILTKIGRLDIWQMQEQYQIKAHYYYYFKNTY